MMTSNDSFRKALIKPVRPEPFGCARDGRVKGILRKITGFGRLGPNGEESINTSIGIYRFRRVSRQGLVVDC